MKKIIYLFGIALFIASCSNDDMQERQDEKNVSSDIDSQICNDPGTILDTLNYPREVSNLSVLQDTAINTSRRADVMVWMSLPSDSDMIDSNNNNDDISFVVQLPTGIFIERVVIREVDTASSNCINDQYIFDLELGMNSSKLNPSVESFSYTLTQSSWAKYEFFAVYTSDNGDRKKRVVAANPTTYPEPGF